MLFLLFIRYQCIDSQDLQIAALRLLNKITETATTTVVNAGAIPKMVKLLRSPSTEVVTHSVQVLSAISSTDSAAFGHNVIETFLQMIYAEQSVSMSEKKTVQQWEIMRSIHFYSIHIHFFYDI